MGVFIDDFEVDAVVAEDVALDSEVTEYPVEEGANYADHVRPLPDSVVLDCVVSDTPFGPLAIRRAASGLVVLRPSDDVYTRLKAIRDEKRLVAVQTGLDTYTNMALRGLSIPRSARDGKSIRFQAQFVKVVSATSERDTILVTMPRAKKGVDLGNKASPFVPAFGLFGSGF